MRAAAIAKLPEIEVDDPSTLAGPRHGSYEILKRIGTGNVGNVYLARDVNDDRRVALKVFDARGARGMPRETAERVFVTEARAAANLHHPHVAAVYGVGDDGDAPFVAMECIDNGRTLQRYCEGPNLLPVDEVARIIKSCAEGLHHAHEQGVLHRDVKPRNILLAIGLEPKLVDFGMSVLSPASDLEASERSPRYLAPEQIKDRQVSRHADIFSLGVVLYQLATGRHPFEAESVEARNARIIGERHLPIRKLRSDLPTELQTITKRCLAKRPANRYPTALHLAADLDVLIDLLHATSPTFTNRKLWRQVRELEYFAPFTESELKETLVSSTVCTFREGDEVIAAGDTASCIYILLEGEVGIRKETFELIYLGPGECIGAIGALTGMPRTATVIALDRCKMLAIPTSFLNNGPVSCQLHLKNALLGKLASQLADTLDSFS